MSDQEGVRTQVVLYQQGMTPRQYLDAFRQGAETILGQGLPPRETQEAITNYAQANAEHLLEQVRRGEANISVANAAVRRQRRWLFAAVGAGTLAALLAFLGGTYLGDSQLRPHYDRAVNSREVATTENKLLRESIGGLEKQLQTHAGEIKEKDKMIGEYVELFEKYFGKPPEKAEETKTDETKQ